MEKQNKKSRASVQYLQGSGIGNTGKNWHSLIGYTVHTYVLLWSQIVNLFWFINRGHMIRNLFGFAAEDQVNTPISHWFGGDHNRTSVTESDKECCQKNRFQENVANDQR
jgi:hypothetical protein